MDNMKDEDDKLFDILMSEKKYNELFAAVRSIIDDAQSKKQSDNILSSLDRQSMAIQKVCDLIKALPEPQISLNHDSVISVVENLNQSVLQSIADLKKAIEKPKPNWEFEVKRYDNGRIEKIIARQLK